jgi:hypothetical protein
MAYCRICNTTDSSVSRLNVKNALWTGCSQWIYFRSGIMQIGKVWSSFWNSRGCQYRHTHGSFTADDSVHSAHDLGQREMLPFMFHLCLTDVQPGGTERQQGRGSGLQSRSSTGGVVWHQHKFSCGHISLHCHSVEWVLHSGFSLPSPLCLRLLASF